MEPECSLPHSHVPAICPYPKPARSSSYPEVLKIHSYIILPITSGYPKWFPSPRPPRQNRNKSLRYIGQYRLQPYGSQPPQNKADITNELSSIIKISRKIFTLATEIMLDNALMTGILSLNY